MARQLEILHYFEVFTVHVDGVNYEIRSPMPVGPDNAAHQVWRNNQLLFIFNPHLDICDDPCWKLNKEYVDRGIDLELVSRTGEEIEGTIYK